MTQSQATRSIIDTHRHIFGPKLRQKLVENIGFDDSKPFPQVFGDEMFFYRESLDVDYSMEIQRQSGVTLCVNSYGGEVDSPRTSSAWPTLMLLKRVRVMSLIPSFPAKKHAPSAFAAATEPARIKSFSTRPKPNGYGSTRRPKMFSFTFIRPW